ncbi:MAG: hypothetical protein DRP78_03800, partial [Candidatus Omnitrophota bacterium]
MFAQYSLEHIDLKYAQKFIDDLENNAKEKKENILAKLEMALKLAQFEEQIMLTELMDSMSMPTGSDGMSGMSGTNINYQILAQAKQKLEDFKTELQKLGEINLAKLDIDQLEQLLAKAKKAPAQPVQIAGVTETEEQKNQDKEKSQNEKTFFANFTFKNIAKLFSWIFPIQANASLHPQTLENIIPAGLQVPVSLNPPPAATEVKINPAAASLVKQESDLSAQAKAQPKDYRVKKGDTLWSVLIKLGHDPFQWANVVNLHNQFASTHPQTGLKQIKVTQSGNLSIVWIYPGQVIKLAFDQVVLPAASGHKDVRLMEKQEIAEQKKQVKPEKSVEFKNESLNQYSQQKDASMFKPALNPLLAELAQFNTQDNLPQDDSVSDLTADIPEEVNKQKYEALKLRNELRSALQKYTELVQARDAYAQELAKLDLWKKDTENYLSLKKNVLDFNSVLEISWQLKLLDKDQAYQLSKKEFIIKGIETLNDQLSGIEQGLNEIEVNQGIIQAGIEDLTDLIEKAQDDISYAQNKLKFLSQAETDWSNALKNLKDESINSLLGIVTQTDIDANQENLITAQKAITRLQWFLDNYDFGGIDPFIPTKGEINAGMSYWTKEINAAKEYLSNLAQKLESSDLKDQEKQLLILQIENLKKKISVGKIVINDLKKDLAVHNGSKEPADTIIHRKIKRVTAEKNYYLHTKILLKAMLDYQDIRLDNGIKDWQNQQIKMAERLAKVNQYLDPDNTDTLDKNDPDNPFGFTGIPFSVPRRIEKIKEAKLKVEENQIKAEKQLVYIEEQLHKEKTKPIDNQDKDFIAYLEKEKAIRAIWIKDANENFAIYIRSLETHDLLEKAYKLEKETLIYGLFFGTDEIKYIGDIKKYLKSNKTIADKQNIARKSIDILGKEQKFYELSGISANAKKAWLEKTRIDAQQDLDINYANTEDNLRNLEPLYQQSLEELKKQAEEVEKALKDVTKRIDKAQTWLEKLNPRNHGVMKKIGAQLSGIIDQTQEFLIQRAPLIEADKQVKKAAFELEQLLRENKEVISEQDFALTLDNGTAVVSKPVFTAFIDNLLKNIEGSTKEKANIKQKALNLSSDALKQLGLTDLQFKPMYGNNDIYFVTHAGYGEWEEMYLEAGNLIKLFGDTTTVNAFVYGLKRHNNEPAGGAFGAGIKLETLSQDRPLKNVVVFDIYKPIWPGQLAYISDTQKGREEKIRLFIFEEFGILLSKDKNGNYRAFVGFAGFGDIPVDKLNAIENDLSSFGGCLKSGYKFYSVPIPTEIKAELRYLYGADPREADAKWEFIDPISKEVLETHTYNGKTKDMSYFLQKLTANLDISGVFNTKDAFNLEFFLENENSSQDDQAGLAAGINLIKTLQIKSTTIDLGAGAKLGKISEYSGQVDVDLPRDWDIKTQISSSDGDTAATVSVAKKVGNVNFTFGVNKNYGDSKAYPYIEANQLLSKKIALDGIMSNEEAESIFNKEQNRLRKLGKSKQPLVSVLPLALENFQNQQLKSEIVKELFKTTNQVNLFLEGHFGVSIDNAQLNSQIKKVFGYASPDIGISLGLEKGDKLDEQDLAAALLDIERKLDQLNKIYAERCRKVINAYINLVHTKWNRDAALEMKKKVRNSVSGELRKEQKKNYADANFNLQRAKSEFLKIIGGDGQKMTEIMLKIPEFGDTFSLRTQVDAAVRIWFSDLEPLQVMVNVGELSWWQKIKYHTGKVFRKLEVNKVAIGWDLDAMLLGGGPYAKLDIPIIISNPLNPDKKEILHLKKQVLSNQAESYVQQIEVENAIAQKQNLIRQKALKEIQKVQAEKDQELSTAIELYNSQAKSEFIAWQKAGQLREHTGFQTDSWMQNVRARAMENINQRIFELKQKKIKEEQKVFPK